MTEEATTQARGQDVGGISTRTSTWLAWSLCAATLVTLALSLGLILLGWSTPLPRGWTPWWDQALSSVGIICAPILGALVASRHPRNPYGWLWLAFGLGLSLQLLAEPYAAYALVVEPGSLPAPQAVYSVLGMGWGMSVTLAPFLLLLFPTGRLPSRRWRFLVWIVAVAGAMLLSLGFFLPSEGDEPFESLLGTEGVVGEAITAVVSALVYVIFAAIVLSALSLVLRYRRAGGVERQQLKWFALAAVLNGAFIVADMLSLDRLLGEALWNLFDAATLASLPVAIGIAILRHRLFDIDVIVNRTLVYGSLTAVLVAAYFGSIVVLQRVFVLLTGQRSTLAVVASTLLIAGLFNPLRRRIQSFIDRRFYRRKYDARKTLEAFSAKLRDETDLDALNSELVGVVSETMQPAHVGLWLREPWRVRDSSRGGRRVAATRRTGDTNKGND